MKISVFGLGKLGGTMAACFAERGFEVIGVDVNAVAVERLMTGLAPAVEFGLDELVGKNKARLSATTDPVVAVNQSEVSFVVVPTPSLENGKFDLHMAERCMTDIGLALKGKDSYHLVVMTSTVLPGSTRNRLIPILEAESGKVCGVDFGVCYNPEFIALGSVINDFLNPDFYLLGQFDERSGNLLKAVHDRVSLNKAPVKRMNLENAELAKIALNSFVTLKISFANLLADFCEVMPGGDVDVVSDAIGTDKRIGRKYLTGGLGFAGPCFPRDNVALAAIGNELGLDVSLLLENHAYNARLPSRLAKQILCSELPGSTVAVLGLAYKPRATVLDWSQGILVCQELSSAGYSVIAHDPLALENARSILSSNICLSSNLEDTLSKADAIIVCTPDDMYRNLCSSSTLGDGKRRVLFDYWRVSGMSQTNSDIRCHYRGRGQSSDLLHRMSSLYSIDRTI